MNFEFRLNIKGNKKESDGSTTTACDGCQCRDSHSEAKSDRSLSLKQRTGIFDGRCHCTSRECIKCQT